MNRRREQELPWSREGPKRPICLKLESDTKQTKTKTKTNTKTRTRGTKRNKTKRNKIENENKERGRGGEEESRGGTGEEKSPQPSIRQRLGGQRRRGRWQGSEGSVGTEGGAHVEGRAGAGVDAIIDHHSREGGEKGKEKEKREGRERRWREEDGRGRREDGIRRERRRSAIELSSLSLLRWVTPTMGGGRRSRKRV